MTTGHPPTAPGGVAMPELVWAAALAAGFLGSAHCAAMCGGIATALGTAAGRPRSGPLLNQCGRLLSYALAGALAGGAGAAAGFAVDAQRWSAILRLATAALVVLIGLEICLAGSTRARWLKLPERWGGRLWRRLNPHLVRHLPAAGPARSLALGMLWGWLPCGLVYSVLLTAAVAGSAARGSAVMLAFGLGTLPAMVGLGLLGSRLPHRDGLAARILGAVLVACGLWSAAVPLATLGGASPHAHHHGAAMTGDARRAAIAEHT